MKETDTLKKITSKKIGSAKLAKSAIGNLGQVLENYKSSQKCLKIQVPPISETTFEAINRDADESAEKTKQLTERLLALQRNLKVKKEIYAENKQTLAKYCNRFLSTKDTLEKSGLTNPKLVVGSGSGTFAYLSGATEVSNHKYVRSKMSDISLNMRKSISQIRSHYQRRETLADTLFKCLELSESALKLHSKLILREHLRQVLHSAGRELEKELEKSSEVKRRLEKMEYRYEGCEKADIKLLRGLKFEIFALERETADSPTDADADLLKKLGLSRETTGQSVNDADEDMPEIRIIFSESLDSRSPDGEGNHRRLISIKDAEF